MLRERHIKLSDSEESQTGTDQKILIENTVGCLTEASAAVIGSISCNHDFSVAVTERF